MPDNEKQAEQLFKAFRRDEEFEALYANNVQFQPSEWDLKAIFGELDFEEGKPFVLQHTSIAMPWLQAKILLYFLALQVGVYELQHGKIVIPPSVFPPEPSLAEGEPPSDALSRMQDYVKKVRELFILR